MPRIPAGDTAKLRSPGSRATVRQLITHTFGLAYWFRNADIVKFKKGHQGAERAALYALL